MTLQVISGNTVVYWHSTGRQGSVIATSDAAGQIVSAAACRARSDIPHEHDLPPTGSPCGYSLSFCDIEGLLARRGSMSASEPAPDAISANEFLNCFSTASASRTRLSALAPRRCKLPGCHERPVLWEEIETIQTIQTVIFGV
ncbi:hypothetical protein [Brevundimonas poindexterae]|uniref:hypothetical protein n=1 Tax=Brevundimonas poindexterae TaxID=74325 RepID=UPI001CFD182B|nr:hypothetical protein [Brevundimonas poindexterae]